ncbi:hypothetical protein LRS13_20850 [Svornostia abyssi]|uniref:Uncharacterized protein n=1 Tax=Svornostia abyssi TaxID=2898438 RepID=A0ABY5PEK0_9ACTN|nr:hypothetical protein LRS13_20850 [Parviterribacteraceae bacterium J379]
MDSDDAAVVLKREIFELLSEDDHFLYELVGSAGIAAGRLPDSITAVADLVESGLVEVWCDPSFVKEGRRARRARALALLRDPLRWHSEVGNADGVVRLALSQDGEAVWSQYCATRKGPVWLTRQS